MDGPSYFEHARREVLPLLPAQFTKIIDVGGSAGGTLSAIKNIAPHAITVCIDANAECVARARAFGHEAIQCDLNGGMPPVFGDCDVVLLLDILEHLIDPWSVLSNIVAQLPRNASVIVSLPNVRYWRVSLNLAFRGRWDLQDAGVLDRTHLRFFTRDTGAALVVQSGLSLLGVQNKLGGGRKRRLLNSLTFGVLKDFLSLQYLYRAVKT